MFLSGIGKVLAIGNTYGIYYLYVYMYTGNIGRGFKKTIIHLMPILQQRSETFFLSFLHTIQCGVSGTNVHILGIQRKL